MQNKQYLVVISVILIGILIGSVAFVYVSLPQPPTQPIASQPYVAPPPQVRLYKKQGGLILNWNHLPEGTEYITIYRSKRGEEKWTKWKTIPIGPGNRESGAVDIASGENLNDYVYYAQAVQTAAGNASSTASGVGGGASGGEIVLWQSATTEIEPLPSASPAPSTSTAQGAPASQSQTAPPPASQGAGTQPQNAGADTPPANVPESTSTIYYYSPSGQITGSSTVQSASFWVQHVNKNIEVGWQNIAAGADNAIVYRSPYENGPWTRLFKQTDPPSSYSIRLVDNTLTAAHYYRMDARDGSAVLQSYGPILLPALE